MGSHIAALPKAYLEQDDYFKSLIGELYQSEEALEDIKGRLQEAQLYWDAEASKYAGLRDAVMRYMGGNPYSYDAPWPDNAEPSGRFQFVGMSAGDAAESAIRYHGKPVPLATIEEILRSGGAKFSAREVNAALMQKADIIRVNGKERPAMYDVRKDESNDG